MSFKIELAKSSDMLDLFDLANDDLVRQNSFNQEKILLSDHQKWFAQKLNDANCYFYIIRQSSDFAGYARFDKSESGEFIITIHLHKDFRGKGLGVKVIELSTQKFFENRSKKTVIAYVKKENLASYKSFVGAGYSVINDNLVYNNNLCYLLKKND